MASSNTLTFDQDPPHRPALSELGGGAKENDAKFPPDPVKHPTAEDDNQKSRQAEAVGRVSPLVRLWVRFSAGTPAIYNVQALGNNVVAASFTLTDEGAGQTLISWKTGAGQPAGALPAAVGLKMGITADVDIDRFRAILTVDGSGNPAARVKTFLGAVATDADFWLEIC